MPDKTNIIIEDTIISLEEKVSVLNRDHGFEVCYNWTIISY